MPMHHVYSTLANDNRYVRYAANPYGGARTVEHSVLIKGGSGINKKNIGTPIGVHTAISEEDFEWLKEDYSFNQHIKNGYITVQKHDVNPEVVAADMSTRQWIKGPDGQPTRGDAFPVVPEEYDTEGDKEKVKPMSGGKKKKVA